MGRGLAPRPTSNLFAWSSTSPETRRWCRSRSRDRSYRRRRKTGLHGESPYLRGLLNMLGVRPDFLTCGEYKSAAEMFMRDGPSAEAEKMQNWLLDSMFDTQLQLIAKGRNVDVAKARASIHFAKWDFRRSVRTSAPRSTRAATFFD